MKRVLLAVALLALPVFGFVGSASAQEFQEMEPLKLTSVCSNNPLETRKWRVQNTNDFSVDFTYNVVGTSQSGVLTAPAAGNGVVKFPGAGDGANYLFFETNTVAGSNTTKITFEGGENTKASGGAACDSFVEFEKIWNGGGSYDINYDELTVTVTGRINGDNPFSWTIGVDNPLQVTPGSTELTDVQESVEGLPEQCTYETDLMSTIIAPSSDSAYDDQTNVATVTITNEVTCEEDDSSEGQVLGDSDIREDVQVEIVPTSGVDAGGADLAIIGVALSTVVLSIGVAVKKFVA